MYKVIAVHVLMLLLCSQVNYSLANSADSTGSTIDFEMFEVRLSSRVVHIHFEVASEKQGQFFIVEKSIDEETWNSVTTLTTKGDHNEMEKYETSIIDFADGVIEYYRLMRIDMYGDTTELGQDIIRRKALKNIQLVPIKGKTHKEIFVTYDSMISAEGIMTVMARDGTIIEDVDISISMGYNRFKLIIKGYDPGDYLITIRDTNENKISKRLVVYK